MKTKLKPNRVSIAVLVEGGIVQEVRCTMPFDLMVVDLDNVDGSSITDIKATITAWEKLTRTHRYN